MQPTTAELNYARSYIGQRETDDVFTERVERLEADFDDREELLNAAIEESLRAQLAVFATQPSQVSLGSMSMGTSSNLSSLSKMLETFIATKGSSQARVTRIWRQPVR